MYTSFTDWESGLYLQHHGVKGQKWGVRRYRNADGSLTDAGKARLLRSFNRESRKLDRRKRNADVELQAKNAKTFAKRAKISAAVSAGLALGNAGMLSKYVINRNSALKGLSKAQGAWDEARRKYSNGRARAEAAYDLSVAKQKLGLLDGTAKTRAAILHAGAVLAGGYAAYNAVRSKIAKNRTTISGHRKAVNRYKEKYADMIKKFGTTSYNDLFKKKKRRH